ncbi:hypothetical protein HID58_053286 [Brassica napus]|uniref:F-box domain-containing protein n=1 Tax=Brassica napus TaxID=3708 RepID=A0ABQ8AEZ8_BRANA|nr:hypothetical protein HID58_053286 [Brassica napus]
MENQEGSGNVPRWENMDKDILSNIFKKLDVVDVIMGASRVCITWFLASHNKTIWNTIKLNDLDSIILDNPFNPNIQASGSRYQLRKILIEINKFSRTVPNSFFFNVYCNVAEEELAIISNGMPNIQKLALPMWTSLDINSIQSAFSKWQNLQTLIIQPFISMTVREVSSVELQAIGENCRNLTTMKFTAMLSKDLANIIIFNLSHCIFTQNTGTGKSCILGMRHKDELAQAGTKKLVGFMVCCSDCTICQYVWKHANNPNRYGLEFRYVKKERWKTDEIKELEL